MRRAVISLLMLGVISAFPTTARAAIGAVTVNGQKVPLAASFQSPMQCILDTVQKYGYQPGRGGVGCFGTRPGNRSAHPGGYACDVDQTSRDVTRLNRRFNSKQQVAIAESCKGVSGCKWRGRKGSDCGHFEQRSAPYFRAGTPSGLRSYHYGKRNSNFKRRRA